VILARLVDAWKHAFHEALPKVADAARGKVEIAFDKALPILKERLPG